MPFEAPGYLGRDRPGRRHREPVEEVAGRPGQVEDDRARVRRLDPGDRLCLARAVGVEPGDRRVVEGVLGAILGIGDALDRVELVLRCDLPVDRRAELHAGLDVEGVGRAAVRRCGNGGGEIRYELVARRARNVVVPDECPDHQVRLDRERVGVVLARRIEAVAEAERLLEGDAVGAARLGRRARRRAERPGRDQADDEHDDCSNSPDSPGPVAHLVLSLAVARHPVETPLRAIISHRRRNVKGRRADSQPARSSSRNRAPATGFSR